MNGRSDGRACLVRMTGAENLQLLEPSLQIIVKRYQIILEQKRQVMSPLWVLIMPT